MLEEEVYGVRRSYMKLEELEEVKELREFHQQ